MIEKIRANKDTNFGFNAATGEYEDLVKAGVIDPTKVTRSALQNAASISALMLTTEAMICEIPEKKSAPDARRRARRSRRHGLLATRVAAIAPHGAEAGERTERYNAARLTLKVGRAAFCLYSVHSRLRSVIPLAPPRSPAVRPRESPSAASS